MLAVSVRQIFLWTIGVMVLSALLVSPLARLLPKALRPRDDASPSWRPLLWSVLASVPSLLILLLLVRAWGGLVPERFRMMHRDESLAWCAFGYALAVLSIYVPFFLLVIPDPRELLQRTRRWLGLAAAVGLILALIGPTSPDFDSGRHGGPVWLLAGLGPQLGGRSLVLAVMAVVGAVGGALLFAAAVRNGRGHGALLLLASWIAINLTGVVNTQMFQRYIDTPTLVLLRGCRLVRRAHGRGRRRPDRRSSRWSSRSWSS